MRSLPDDFEITALSTTRRESADAAGKLFGVPLVFDNHRDLVNNADVDVVTITVKVPHHFDAGDVTGLLESGAAFSIHYRGGHSRGTNMLWEINGTDGDLQLTAAGGQTQIFEMTVRGGKGGQSSLELLPVPEKYRWSWLQGPSTNVAQAYARFARDSQSVFRPVEAY